MDWKWIFIIARTISGPNQTNEIGDKELHNQFYAQKSAIAEYANARKQ